MATGSAISAPPAVRRPHWTVNSPMKSCSATVTGLTVWPDSIMAKRYSFQDVMKT